MVHSAIESATAAAISGTLSEKLRVVLLEAATKLVAALQKPEDAITKLAYQVSRQPLQDYVQADQCRLSLLYSWPREPCWNWMFSNTL